MQFIILWHIKKSLKAVLKQDDLNVNKKPNYLINNIEAVFS